MRIGEGRKKYVTYTLFYSRILLCLHYASQSREGAQREIVLSVKMSGASFLWNSSVEGAVRLFRRTQKGERMK